MGGRDEAQDGLGDPCERIAKNGMGIASSGVETRGKGLVLGGIGIAERGRELLSHGIDLTGTVMLWQNREPNRWGLPRNSAPETVVQ